MTTLAEIEGLVDELMMSAWVDGKADVVNSHESKDDRAALLAAVKGIIEDRDEWHDRYTAARAALDLALNKPAKGVKP